MPDNHYDTDVNDAAWALLAPLLPAARAGGRPRTTDIRAVINAIFYLLRSGCQWRLLPREFPAWGTVYHYFRMWKGSGVWTCLQREIYEQTRRKAGRSVCPSMVIMDGQSVKTTERGGVRGFDGHKLIKGRKRHILVDTLGLLIACRVEPANTSDRKAASLLLGGLGPLFPDIRTVMADGGHESCKLARQLRRDDGWTLQIIKRRQRAFKIMGLTWIVERSLAWLGRNRRLSKDYEYMVQTSETMIDIAALRIMLNRLAPAGYFSNTLLVYAPKAWLSLYGSYVRSFIPTTPSAVNLAGRQFSPEYDHQWEAGMKLTSFADRVMSTIAFFQIEKQNILAPDPNNPIFSVQNGRERSKGVEVKFRGSLLRGLNLLTSYAFIQAQVTQSTVYPVGAILPNAPRNSGAAWATFQVLGCGRTLCGPQMRLSLLLLDPRSYRWMCSLICPTCK